MFAGTAEGVVVVVAPTETKVVLTAFLNLSGAVARFPMGAFGVEEELAGEIAANELEALAEDFIGDAEAVGVLGEKAAAGLPQFFGPNDAAQLGSVERRRDKAAISVALDGFQAGAVFFGNDNAAITRERFAFDFGGKIVSSDEVGDELRTESDDGWILLFGRAQHDPREGRAWIFINGFAVRSFSILFEDKADFEKGILFGG